MPESKTAAPRAAPPTPGIRVNGYLVAVVVVAIAFGLRFGLYGGLNSRLPFAFFLPAALIAAWYGGLGPGMLAAAAGLLLGDYFFLPPHDAWGPLGESAQTAVGVYAVTATLGVILIGNLQNRLRNLQCELARRTATDREAAL
jgi:K+-sensing histidine kinase KdpD